MFYYGYKNIMITIESILKHKLHGDERLNIYA